MPQGGPISPLLSNIYGHALDALFEQEAGHLGTLIRYADDGVILCRSEVDARAAMAWLERRARRLHLQLHPDKTRVIRMEDGMEGFDFLGFHHRMVMSHRYGRRFCQRWPSRRAMAALRARIKVITASRSNLPFPITVVIRQLNPVLRGWGQYFRWGNSGKHFSRIDYYVYERLALFDSKKRQKRGRRWGEHDYDWLRRLPVYHLTGTVRYGMPATART